MDEGSNNSLKDYHNYSICDCNMVFIGSIYYNDIERTMPYGTGK